MSSATVPSAKHALRKLLASTLRSLPPAHVSSSSTAIARRFPRSILLSRPTAPHAGGADRSGSVGVAVYLSMPAGEVATDDLVRELVGGDGGGDAATTTTEKTTTTTKVSVPHLYPAAASPELRMRFVALRPGESVRDFERDKWGIPVVPDADEREAVHGRDIDVVVTPGVAFDAGGGRLGRGKGFYDRAFKQIDRERAEDGLPPALKVGLALEEQMVESVPRDEHDVLLDGVVTPSRVVVVSDALRRAIGS